LLLEKLKKRDNVREKSHKPKQNLKVQTQSEEQIVQMEDLKA
jgi:hypothetical protein